MSLYYYEHIQIHIHIYFNSQLLFYANYTICDVNFNLYMDFNEMCVNCDEHSCDSELEILY